MTTSIESIDSATSRLLVGGVEAFRFGAAGISGMVVQRAYAEYTASADMTAVIPGDDTIPQITEGTQIISVAFTPKSATSRIRLRFDGVGTAATSTHLQAALFSSASANALRSARAIVQAAGYAAVISAEAEYVPGSTAPVTFSVRVGADGATTVRFNGTNTARLLGGSQAATLVIEEIAA
jgi:hypothetical protein